MLVSVSNVASSHKKEKKPYRSESDNVCRNFSLLKAFSNNNMRFLVAFTTLALTCSIVSAGSTTFYSGEGVSTYDEAVALCANDRLVLATQDEWCEYAKNNPSRREYGSAPIYGGNNYMDVEEACGIAQDEAPQRTSGRVERGGGRGRGGRQLQEVNSILCASKSGRAAPQDPDTCITYFGSQGNSQNGKEKSPHCWVCHGTGSVNNNPYVDICVDADSLDKNNGHNGPRHNDWTGPGDNGKLNDFIWCPTGWDITEENRITLVDAENGEKVPSTFVGDDGKTYDAKTCAAVPAQAPSPTPSDRNPPQDDVSSSDRTTSDSYSKGDPHFKV